MQGKYNLLCLNSLLFKFFVFSLLQNIETLRNAPFWAITQQEDLIP